MFPVAVILPWMLILPLPVILLPFKSKSAPSCGVVSSTISLMPVTTVPPAVEPSPTNSLFVSVV